MREILYIRLQRADADAPVDYCIAKSDAVVAFGVSQAPLSQLAALAAQRRVVVLVPAADIRLASVQVPARQAAKVLQAAPFMLEEQLAEDVDELHFALGARQPDQRWPLAIVAHARMQSWLDLLQFHGLQPQQLIPDLLALAVPDAAHFCVLIDGGQALVRTAAGAGFVCLLDDLPLCLNLADPDKQRRLRLILARGENFDPSSLPWPVEVLHGFGSSFEALLQQLRGTQAINLLQARYSQREHLLRHLLPWRQAGIAAAVTLALAGALYVAQSLRMSRDLRQQEAANVARFQQLFPDEARIVDLSAQLDQRVAGLQSGGGSFLPLTETLADALAAVPGLSLQSLQYREGALYASLSASKLELLDSLKTWFAGGHGTAFSVESANAGSDGVQLRIRLGGS